MNSSESKATLAVGSSDWLDALEKLAARIKRAREELGKDPEIEGYCWNFEEAEKQILGTLDSIRRSTE